MSYFAIVSGGQTGADRGALEAALEMDAPYHGWLPKGRRAEDGKVSEVFDKLKETNNQGYVFRTEMNVADSGATVIFTYGPLTGGSLKTLEFIQRQKKPYLWIDLTIAGEYAPVILQFIQQHGIRELNVAGNRESKAPGIQQKVKTIMMQVLARLT